MLTKGDNNDADDRSLYPGGQLWLERKHVIGRVKGYSPLAFLHTKVQSVR